MFSKIKSFFGGTSEEPSTPPLTTSSKENIAWVNPERLSKRGVSSYNKAKFEEEISSIKKRKFDTIDLTLYQEYLKSGDPQKIEEATQELNVFKQIIIDTSLLTSEQIQKKYRRSKIAGKIVTTLGIATSIASGVIDPTPFLTQLNTSPNIISQIANVAGRTSTGFNVVNIGLEGSEVAGKSTPQFLQTKIGKVSSKVILPISLLVLSSLTGPAAPVFFGMAITTTVLKGGTNYLEHKYKNQLEKLKLDQQSLINTIDEMLQNNGTIFKKTESPIFNKQRKIKNQINSLLNTSTNQQSLLTQFPEENKQIANAILGQMIENVKNEGSNTAFNQEMEKLRIIEKVPEEEIQKMRENRNTRRTKLKKLIGLQGGRRSGTRRTVKK